MQYTYWVGDAQDPGASSPARQPGRWPNVVEYAITAPKKGTAPRSWRLMYWYQGGWKLADQQAAMRFEEVEYIKDIDNPNPLQLAFAQIARGRLKGSASV